ncbi:putative inorganic carbon transporter subunit DabA, partial [Falsiroseomonas oryziterrae]|uniref:putative inorganic carbon transporter subunit DabA n=1 Tax=Falsiroseomonas oryziterrae TaxID=2911368 RepID=UPI001F37EF28
LRHGRPEAAQPAALDAAGAARVAPQPSAVNRVMIRWLAAFLDEGQAAWPMPGREKGLWPAVRALARHDDEIPDGAAAEKLSSDPLAALAVLLADVPENERAVLMTRHLAALSGWAGYVKWRAQEAAHAWAEAAPATLADMLALRLFLARQFNEAPAAPPAPAVAEAEAIWLEAWEETWRRDLARRLAVPAPAAQAAPLAQLVFCIDVRSEVLRRHLERTGPWETLGFAGFFGAAVAVQPFGAEGAYASCPVLLQPRHVIPEVAADQAEGAKALGGLQRLKGVKQGLRALKESVAGAFGFVEATGAAFGAAMVARTVTPRGAQAAANGLRQRIAPAARTAPRVAL